MGKSTGDTERGMGLDTYTEIAGNKVGKGQFPAGAGGNVDEFFSLRAPHFYPDKNCKLVY